MCSERICFVFCRVFRVEQSKLKQLPVMQQFLVKETVTKFMCNYDLPLLRIQTRIYNNRLPAVVLNYHSRQGAQIFFSDPDPIELRNSFRTAAF